MLLLLCLQLRDKALVVPGKEICMIGMAISLLTRYDMVSHGCVPFCRQLLNLPLDCFNFLRAEQSIRSFLQLLKIQSGTC